MLHSLTLLLSLLACDGVPDPADDSGLTDSGTDTVIDDDVFYDCETELTAPADGVCAAVAGSTGAIVLRGDVLAEDGAYLGGELLIGSDGLIDCFGCDCSGSAAYADATQITCAEGVISPGLVNPHDHIGYTEGHPIDLGDQRYDHRHGWRGALSTPQNDSNRGKELGELRMLLSGVTSMVGSGGTDGMVRNLDESDMEGLSLERVDNQTFPLGDSDERFQDDCDWDYRESELEVARQNAYLPHIAEGIDDYAAEEFRCTSSSFDGAQDYTEPNAAHIHAIGLSAEDYYRMALEGTGIVWSPRSNIALYGHTARVDLFHRLGGVISLGTDWTYSGSINSVRELVCADGLNRDYLDGVFTDRDLWKMATLNGALATGSEDLIGSISEGLVADIAVYDARSLEAYRAIIEAEAPGVVLVLRGGEALYGEADTLTALGESCETLDVCGETRSVCAEREYGDTWDEILDTVGSAYGPFFCGVPDGEPTCTPFRSGEYSGITSETDGDGDGLADASDNCPAVFNPVRPIDGGVQPDADGDGEGDACDLTPLPADLDGDGVDDEDDNCIFDANSDQADADEDDHGDVCDPCPETANPDTLCALAPSTATIYEVQKGTVSEGTFVEIAGVVVTGVASSGYSIQDPDRLDSPEYSGMYIYVGGSPGLGRGDVVTVVGEVGEYFGETQLSQDSVTVTSDAGLASCTGSDSAITPAAISVAEATDEAWEGVLVTLTDGTVTDEAYDCSVDGDSCSDAGLWEIGGSSGVVVFDRLYECDDWGARVGELPVTGVMTYRYDRRRIMPRGEGDLGG